MLYARTTRLNRTRSFRRNTLKWAFLKRTLSKWRSFLMLIKEREIRKHESILCSMIKDIQSLFNAYTISQTFFLHEIHYSKSNLFFYRNLTMHSNSYLLFSGTQKHCIEKIILFLLHKQHLSLNWAQLVLMKLFSSTGVIIILLYFSKIPYRKKKYFVKLIYWNPKECNSVN